MNSTEPSPSVTRVIDKFQFSHAETPESLRHLLCLVGKLFTNARRGMQQKNEAARAKHWE